MRQFSSGRKDLAGAADVKPERVNVFTLLIEGDSSYKHCTTTRLDGQKIERWRLLSFITLSTRSCLPFPPIVRTAAARVSHSHFVCFLFHGAYVTSSLCDQTTFPYFGCLTLLPTSWEPHSDKSSWQRLGNIFTKYYVMTQVNVVTQLRTTCR